MLPGLGAFPRSDLNLDGARGRAPFWATKHQGLRAADSYRLPTRQASNPPTPRLPTGTDFSINNVPNLGALLYSIMSNSCERAHRLYGGLSHRSSQLDSFD